jgi:iron(III) transport system permease protein
VALALPVVTGRAAPLGRWPAQVSRVALPLLFTAALAYLVVLPLWRIQAVALENDAHGYRTAFGASTFGETLKRTILLALGSLVIGMVLGTGLAWAATRIPPRWRILSAVPIVPIIVPAVANVTGWVFMLSPRPGYLNAMLRRLPWWSDLNSGPVDIYTLPWIVLLTGFGLTAFVYLFVSAGLRNINGELIEAALVSGSSSTAAFFRITLPLLRPVLIYGGGVALLLGLGQFTAPLLLGRNAGIDVLTTDIYQSVSQSPIDYSVAAAIGSPLIVLGLTVVIVQRISLGDHRRFITHGGKAFRTQSRPSKLAAAALIIYGTLATALPVGALAIVALSPFWSGTIRTSTFTLDNFRRIFDEARVTEAISTSLVVSLIAVAIALPVGFIASTLLLRSRIPRWQRTVLDLIVAMPLGIPAVVFGAGFLLQYTREPLVLYGSRWVVILVYLTLMLPFTTRMQMSGMVALGDAYVEASRVSGAGVVRTNLKIILPLLRPTLGAAAALMFVLLTHEFTASLLVRSSTMQTMGTALYDFWSNGFYPEVAAIALVMTAVTLVGVIAAIMVGGVDALSKL